MTTQRIIAAIVLVLVMIFTIYTRSVWSNHTINLLYLIELPLMSLSLYAFMTNKSIWRFNKS